MSTPLDLKRIIRHSVRMYFAPLTGGCKGIPEEYRRLDTELDHRCRHEAQARRCGAASRADQ